ncbi:hypothetical protein L6164_007785 [Bauhinia variegata]|uniref:Uncharacterized protein n=1 Tax=Bauhinia variegata TaxID=167791 RepID=A0ACB9PFU7_BAUVA|nr:hypothetical protein L6164_007785 [Bauhinia variegata]
MEEITTWVIESEYYQRELVNLEEKRRKLEENYETSITKIQHVPYYMRNLQKYVKYYIPNLISIGPIHKGNERLKRGHEFKLMWTSMYAEENRQTPEQLLTRIVNNIKGLRGLFSPEFVSIRDRHLAWMLFVDGCAVLQIMEKANLSKLEDLKVKVDIQVINMFTTLESSPQIETLKQSSPPTHLLDCLRTYFLSSVMDSNHKDEHQLNVRQLEDEQIKAANLSNVAGTSANEKEKYISYRNIRELKAAAIQVKRKNNISLKNISFSSSFFGGKLYLPPLILDDSTVTVLWNLVAYEMCSDFKNNLEICSYVKLLDLLIDHPEDVRELRSSGILQNNLGSDEEVVELFNAIGSGLLHNPSQYSRIRDEVEKHYKKKLSIWMAEAYYIYFRSPWTVVALLAALIALVLTALQTWLAFKSS